MAYEYTPPKYAQVIGELQRRIEGGEYPPGSLLPSENQLSAEFGIARPTVVRALRVLRDNGWIETQQGKGSFVRGRPALAEVSQARRGQAELDRAEPKEDGELLEAGLAVPPARVAGLLAIPPGSEAACRRRLIRAEGMASEIITLWLPAALAAGAGVTGNAALPGGIRQHLAKTKDIRIDHVIERVTARRPDAREAEVLGIAADAPVLALYVTGRDASGSPVLVLDIAMPGDAHELEDAYPVG